MNFLGIPCKEDLAKIVILPVPFDKTTTYIHGAEKGPSALIKASCNLELYDIETDSEVYKKGIFTAPPILATTSETMLEETHQRVLSYLQKDKFTVTLGGEHAISSAPIQAHAEFFGSISVLQFDAHSDLVFAYEGNPYSHASVMARVLEVPNVEKIVSIGVRSMAADERSLLKKTKPFFAHTLFGDHVWMQSALSELSDNVYITFDLDVFDSSVMPSTGTPEPGGLFWHQLLPFLNLVAKNKTIVGFDIVELCPIPGFAAPDFLAAKLVYKLLSYIFKQKDHSHGNSLLHEETFQTF
jgi:agmatinase